VEANRIHSYRTSCCITYRVLNKFDLLMGNTLGYSDGVIITVNKADKLWVVSFSVLPTQIILFRVSIFINRLNDCYGVVNYIFHGVTSFVVVWFTQTPFGVPLGLLYIALALMQINNLNRGLIRNSGMSLTG